MDTLTNKTDDELGQEHGNHLNGLMDMLDLLSGPPGPVKLQALMHIQGIIGIENELGLRGAVDQLRASEMIQRGSDHQNRLQNFLLQFIALCGREHFAPARPLIQSYQEYFEAYSGSEAPSDTQFRQRVEEQCEQATPQT